MDNKIDSQFYANHLIDEKAILSSLNKRHLPNFKKNNVYFSSKSKASAIQILKTEREKKKTIHLDANDKF